MRHGHARGHGGCHRRGEICVVLPVPEARQRHGALRQTGQHAHRCPLELHHALRLCEPHLLGRHVHYPVDARDRGHSGGSGIGGPCLPGERCGESAGDLLPETHDHGGLFQVPHALQAFPHARHLPGERRRRCLDRHNAETCQRSQADPCLHHRCGHGNR